MFPRQFFGIKSGGRLLSHFFECKSEVSRRWISLLQELKAALPKTKVLALDVSCDLKLKPLDPHSMVDDSIIARAYGPEGSEFFMQLTDLENVSVFAARSTALQGVKRPLVEVEIPVSCDVDIYSRLGNVSVESFVSNHLSVDAENGDVTCKKLKCGKMLLRSHSGSVNCEGMLLGNIKIRAGKLGVITGVNFQGDLLEAETDDGEIVITSVYSDRSFFTTKKGSINLKSLHRKSSVAIQEGNISILGLDGSLEARVDTGNVKLQVTQLIEDSFIETKNGDVSLSMANDNVCLLDLLAKDIVILDDSLSSSGRIEPSSSLKLFRSSPKNDETPAVMKVICEKGEVCLKEESWISSLKIGGR
ncbi:uncharacterized protein LOC124170698 [Ischnura elegans]|uniref:uncharacterized protein LOC124170698 n=1 Tax=Ischnura elegans TaxID=197161 RepID=UPI001ED88200|nr:uncharacterized protein LOC124170698 [Ischnura elegans]